MSKQQNQYNYSSDSDHEELYEEKFLKKAGIQRTEVPTAWTHGVQINFNPMDQLRESKKNPSSNNLTKTTYEVDAFRFKERQNLIQIVENKSLEGDLSKLDAQKWLQKINKKIGDLRTLQANIQQYGEETIQIIIKPLKTMNNVVLEGADKLRFLKIFVECKAVKFRFAADLEGSLEEKDFLQQLNNKIHTEIKDYRVTFHFGCPDASSDAKHYHSRTDKYLNTGDNKKVAPVDQKKAGTLSSAPGIQKYLRRLERIDNILKDLEGDTYPQEIKRSVTITLNENNGNEKIQYFLTASQKKKNGAPTHHKQIEQVEKGVRDTIAPFGYTAPIQLNFLENAKGVVTGIEVTTKPSKFYLIYIYEEKRKIIQTEIDKLTNIGKSPPMVPSARRSSLPMPTLSISPNTIYAENTSSTGTCADESSKPKPVTPFSTVTSSAS